MRIAVTGATGTVGRAFIAAAMAEGHDVLALARDPDGVESGGACAPIDLLQEPCCDPDFLRGVDTVVHLAAAIIMDPQDRAEADRLWQVNVLGTGALVATMAKAGVPHMVMASTANLYDPLAGTADEHSPMRADRRSLYLGSKAAQEFHAAEGCRAAGIALATMRISSVVQTGGDIITRIAGRIARSEEAGIADPSYGADFVALDDVVSGLLLACEMRLSGIFNLSSGRRVTLGEVGTIVRSQLSAEANTCPTDPGPGGDNGYAAADCAKLVAHGYKPSSIARIVERTLREVQPRRHAIGA